MVIIHNVIMYNIVKMHNVYFSIFRANITSHWCKKRFLHFYSTSWPHHFPRFNCRPCSAEGGSVAHAAVVALAANGFPDGWALRAHPSAKP